MPVLLPPSCHPKPKLSSIAFRSSEVRGKLLELDTHGETDPLGFFYQSIADVLAPKLSVILRKLIWDGEFPDY